MVASSAWVFTQAYAAYGLLEGLATMTEELRLALSCTTRVWLMVSAACAPGRMAVSSARQLHEVIRSRERGDMVFDRAGMVDSRCGHLELVSRQVYREGDFSLCYTVGDNCCIRVRLVRGVEHHLRWAIYV